MDRSSVATPKYINGTTPRIDLPPHVQHALSIQKFHKGNLAYGDVHRHRGTSNFTIVTGLSVLTLIDETLMRLMWEAREDMEEGQVA
jgi:hypothetical protein